MPEKNFQVNSCAGNIFQGNYLTNPRNPPPLPIRTASLRPWWQS